jgi:hypothetical protein
MLSVRRSDWDQSMNHDRRCAHRDHTWFRFNVDQMMDRTGGQAMRNLLTIESAHYFTF